VEAAQLALLKELGEFLATASNKPAGRHHGQRAAARDARAEQRDQRSGRAITTA